MYYNKQSVHKTGRHFSHYKEMRKQKSLNIDYLQTFSVTCKLLTAIIKEIDLIVSEEFRHYQRLQKLSKRITEW